MPINKQLADRCIELMNDALSMDRVAISALCSNRVKCNPQLAGHPTIQCGPDSVGLIGILNGLCGVFDHGPRTGWGPITAVMASEESTEILRFERTDDRSLKQQADAPDWVQPFEPLPSSPPEL
jgi:hypothetical protein